MARFIVWGYPWLLRALLLSAAALLAAGLPALRDALRLRAHRGAWIAALALTALAFGLRFHAPPSHRVYFDEYEHLDAALNLKRQSAFALSMAEGPELDSLEPPLWPGAGHQLLSWFGRRWNAAASALTVPALWAAGTLAYGQAAGLAAGLLWLGSPLAQGFAPTADLSPSAALLAALGLAALLAELVPAGLLLLLCAAHARPEAALLLPLGWVLPKERKPARWTIPALLLLLVPLAMIPRLNRARGIEGYSEGPLTALRHVLRHGPRDLWFLARPAGLAWTLTWPAAFALWRGRTLRSVRALAAVALGLLLAYAAHYVGDFGTPGSERYALLLLLPLSLLAGAGLAELPPARALAAAAAAALLGFFAPLPAPTPDFAREDAVLARGRRDLPADAAVIAFSVPAVAVETGRAAVSPYLLMDGVPLPAGSPFVLKDYWTVARSTDAARLDAWLAQRYASTPSLVDEKGWGFYALTPRPPAPPPLAKSRSRAR